MWKPRSTRRWLGAAWVMTTWCAVTASPVLGNAGSGKARLEEARAAYASAVAALEVAQAELNALESEEALGGVAGPFAIGGVESPGPREGEPPMPATPVPGFFDWKSWNKSVTFGLNGSAGNSDALSGHLTVGLDREINRHKTRLDALYRATQRDGESTENRLRVDVRHDWLPPEDGRWRWWIKGTYEFDDFQSWDHRASGHTGFGYEMLKEPETSLVWRMGLGGSQTFGGENDDFAPEALLTGVDFARQIKQDQRVVFGTELFFDLREAEDYRVNSSMNYEITIDRETGMILRTGVDHRFESEPGGQAERSDFNYFMSLGWRF
jgi:putative salt-induced outer membrane protein YdiY